MPPVVDVKPDLVIEPSGVVRSSATGSPALKRFAGSYNLAVASPGLLLFGDAASLAWRRARVS